VKRLIYPQITADSFLAVRAMHVHDR